MNNTESAGKNILFKDYTCSIKSCVILVMMDSEKLRKCFDERKTQHNITFQLKEEQLSIALSLAKGKSCLGFLPTGFGKTLCFIINSIVNDFHTINIIVSPLLSLMDNQIVTMKKWNLTCVRISADTTAEEKIRIARGDFNFVFSSPESVLKPAWRDVFFSEIWQSRVSCIIFDEAHCLSEWGEDFRPEYREMAKLRSFFKVPILAVTATCTNKVKYDILSILQLDIEETDVVSKSPDRQNISLSCYKTKQKSYEDELAFLISHIKRNGKNAKKVIIYCRSIDVVAEVFISLKEALNKNAYVDGIQDSSHILIEMYHKGTHEISKSRILTEFSKPGSIIRCLVATVALGMGIDIPDIDMVLHIGCPKSVISYWQEAGRCARDGRHGLSLIIFDNFTASLKSTEKRMSELVKNSEERCIRKMIIEHFDAIDMENLDRSPCVGCDEHLCVCEACNCCSTCAKKCPCVDRSSSNINNFLVM